MGSIKLLGAVQAKVEEPKAQNKGSLFVDAEVKGMIVKALVDTGANHSFVRASVANKLGLKTAKTGECVKAVNSEAEPVMGTAKGVKIKIGGWTGKIDLSVIELDDYELILGMDWFDQAKACVMPHTNSLVIMGGTMPCTIMATRGNSCKASTVSAIHLKKLEEEVQRDGVAKEKATPSTSSRTRNRKRRRRNKSKKSKLIHRSHEDTKAPRNEGVAESSGGECHIPPPRRGSSAMQRLRFQGGT